MTSSSIIREVGERGEEEVVPIQTKMKHSCILATIDTARLLSELAAVRRWKDKLNGVISRVYLKGSYFSHRVHE